MRPGSEVKLPAEESRHLLKVMRARTGDKLVIFGASGQFEAELTGTADRRTALVRVGQAVSAPSPSAVHMTFIVPWIKGGKTELLVQKLTELGVSQITVFQARRDVVRGDDSKLDRLQRVALEACKQCERVDVPQIVFAADIVTAVERNDQTPPENRFLLHERQGENLFGQLVPTAVSRSKNIVVASGPEGGWHPDEVEALKDRVVLTSLGDRILRAETAPIAAAAVVLATAGEL